MGYDDDIGVKSFEEFFETSDPEFVPWLYGWLTENAAGENFLKLTECYNEVTKVEILSTVFKLVSKRSSVHANNHINKEIINIMSMLYKKAPGRDRAVDSETIELALEATYGRQIIAKDIRYLRVFDISPLDYLEYYCNKNDIIMSYFNFCDNFKIPFSKIIMKKGGIDKILKECREDGFDQCEFICRAIGGCKYHMSIDKLTKISIDELTHNGKDYPSDKYLFIYMFQLGKHGGNIDAAELNEARKKVTEEFNLLERIEIALYLRKQKIKIPFLRWET